VFSTFFAFLGNAGFQDVHLAPHAFHGSRTLPRFAHEQNNHDENDGEDGSTQSARHVDKQRGVEGWRRRRRVDVLQLTEVVYQTSSHEYLYRHIADLMT